MAWTFSNWSSQPKLRTRVLILRQHVQEVADTIQARISSGGSTFDPAPLQSYHNTMLTQLNSLEIALARSPRISRGRLAPGGTSTPLLYQGFSQ